ncbi:uncharacterized protein [Branchiostoma lanceolatum]|uniref:uncharacterized protein n=1 Tax=Branchiostoma lanceolatum TaxID=7740 RepID=UPI0034571833
MVANIGNECPLPNEETSAVYTVYGDTLSKTEMAEYGEVEIVWKGEPTGDVCVVGSWNAWKEGKKLAKSKDSEEYVARLSLPHGRYEYKFCIDKQRWTHDGTQPSVMNKYGSYNNVLLVTQAADDKLGSQDRTGPAEEVALEREVDFFMVNSSNIACETAKVSAFAEWVIPRPPSGPDAADTIVHPIDETLPPSDPNVNDMVVVSLEVGEALPPNDQGGTDIRKRANTMVISLHETAPPSDREGTDTQERADPVDETLSPSACEGTDTQEEGDAAVPDDDTAQSELYYSYFSWITEAIFGKTSD